MTDVRNAGEVREVLLTTAARLTASGVVREVLLITPTSLVVSSIAREVLLLSPPPITGGQTVVTINSS